MSRELKHVSCCSQLTCFFYIYSNALLEICQLCQSCRGEIVTHSARDMTRMGALLYNNIIITDITDIADIPVTKPKVCEHVGFPSGDITDIVFVGCVADRGHASLDISAR